MEFKIGNFNMDYSTLLVKEAEHLQAANDKRHIQFVKRVFDRFRKAHGYPPRDDAVMQQVIRREFQRRCGCLKVKPPTDQ